MSTEREHAHGRKHDDDQLRHDERSVGRINRSALLQAPEHPVTSGLIARKAARDGNGVEEGADQAIATAASSSGMALPSPILRKFEASLGADLSSVRVHTGAESQTAASAVGAKAYTMGQDIHFGAGHYDPSSGAGEHLLAHEVAHTVQQAGGTPTRQDKLEVSTPFDPAEHEADSAADAMVAGRSASVSFSSGVARSTVFRSPGLQSPAASSVAEAAREGVLTAQQEADAAIDRVTKWTVEQWTKYVGVTAESPAVVWQPSLLRLGIGAAAGAGIGKAAGAAAAAVEELPAIGALVGTGIDLLGDGLKDFATEKIEGGKELDPEEASAKGRAAASAALVKQLQVIYTNATAIKGHINGSYQRALMSVASPGVDADTAARLNTWAGADIAASRSIVPAGDAMYQQMLLTWVGEHASDGNGQPTSGTNRESFKDACNDLFGTGSIPNYWAMQVRQDLLEMGLPTAQADARLNDKSVDRGGEMLFESAVDLNALARTFASESTPEFLHIAQGGQFQVHLVYALETAGGDPIFGPGYTHLVSARYTLTTQGLAGGDKVLSHASTHADMTRAT